MYNSIGEAHGRKFHIFFNRCYSYFPLMNFSISGFTNYDKFNNNKIKTVHIYICLFHEDSKCTCI